MTRIRCRISVLKNVSCTSCRKEICHLWTHLSDRQGAITLIIVCYSTGSFSLYNEKQAINISAIWWEIILPTAYLVNITRYSVPIKELTHLSDLYWSYHFSHPVPTHLQPGSIATQNSLQLFGDDSHILEIFCGKKSPPLLPWYTIQWTCGSSSPAVGSGPRHHQGHTSQDEQ